MNGVSSLQELDAAFPVRTRLTRALAGGCDLKVAVTRWPALSIHPRPPLRRPAARRVVLNHYKWRTGLRDRLVKRYVDFTLAGIPWAGESARLLNELQQHGRFRVELWPAEELSNLCDQDRDG